jgi:hypothetical protein
MYLESAYICVICVRHRMITIYSRSMYVVYSKKVKLSLCLIS